MEIINQTNNNSISELDLLSDAQDIAAMPVQFNFDDLADGEEDNPDLIYGDGDDNILFGEDGNDTMFGNGGNDTMFGGVGDNLMFGDSGNDWLYGSTDDDTLYGNNDNDILIGGGGKDKLVGGAGNDALFGLSVFGTANLDTLQGNSGADKFYLGSSNSYFHPGLYYLGLGHATIVDYDETEKDKIVIYSYDLFGGDNADHYTFGSGHWGGSGALDGEVYHDGDLIGVVYDTPNLDISDFSFY